MAARRMHVVLAQELVSEIDRIVGKRQRSQFLAEAASRELLRQRQLRALQQAAGAWTARGRPDLMKGGGVLFVQRMRVENERRLRRLRSQA